MVNSLLFFGNSKDQNNDFVPNSLELITSNGGWVVGIVLMVGLVLIAASRIYEANYIKSLVSSYFGPSMKEDIQKLDVNLSSLSSIIILLTGFFGCWVSLYLFIQHGRFPQIQSPMVWAAIGALIFLLLQLSMMSFTAFVTGEFGRMRDVFIQTVLNIQFTGLFFFLFGMIWFLYPIYGAVFSKIFVVALILTSLIRLLKGIYASLTNGISWYYIILYFCTLEILPLFILYLVVNDYFLS